jgi:hypothetical protein
MTINDEKFIASAIDESGDFLRSYIGFDALVLNIQLAVGAEFGVPLYQNYYGISMNEEFTINAGLKNSIF